MTEFASVDKIINTLLSSSDIVNNVDTFSSEGVVTPMIIFSDTIPSEWDVKARSINLYTLNVMNNISYDKQYFCAACRSTSYLKSRELAYYVVQALNRLCIKDVFIVAGLGSTITPSDMSIDNFNTPVDILIRSN